MQVVVYDGYTKWMLPVKELLFFIFIFALVPMLDDEVTPNSIAFHLDIWNVVFGWNFYVYFWFVVCLEHSNVKDLGEKFDFVAILIFNFISPSFNQITDFNDDSEHYKGYNLTIATKLRHD